MKSLSVTRLSDDQVPFFANSLLCSNATKLEMCKCGGLSRAGASAIAGVLQEGAAPKLKWVVFASGSPEATKIVQAAVLARGLEFNGMLCKERGPQPGSPARHAAARMGGA